MKKLSKAIKPVSNINGKIQLPGSKSITHRALIMAALATGPGQIGNPLRAEDTLLTGKALEALGATIEWGADSVRVIPPAFRWGQPDGPIFLGNSGTSARLLLAVFSAGSGKFVLDGTPRLRQRPVGPAAEALQKLGVKLRWVGEPGFLPVEIDSGGLSGGDVYVNASESSQFLSGVLIAAPCAFGKVSVEWSEPVASWPYVEITLGMMKEAGIRFERQGSNRIAIPGASGIRAPQFHRRGRLLHRILFLGGRRGDRRARIDLPRIAESHQGDCRFLGVLDKMGCRIEWQAEGVRVTGPEHLPPIDVDMNEMPTWYHTGVLCAFANGTSRIRNVAHLRIKESDRRSTVAAGLKVLGVEARELSDGLIINGCTRFGLPSGPISAFDDHRIAMAFALAGLRLNGVVIDGAESVSKSFPEFWDVFESLGKSGLISKSS